MVPTVLLENLTSGAEFVLEATYVGVPDDKWGEIPMALVKKTPGATETEEDLLKYLQVEGVDAGKITKWMLPVYVAFVDEIPKTSVGKYNKIEVRKGMDDYVAKEGGYLSTVFEAAEITHFGKIDHCRQETDPADPFLQSGSRHFVASGL